MARTRATSMEALEKKIEAGQQKVLRTKAAYDEAVEELQKLLDKRTALQTDELMKAIVKSNRTYIKMWFIIWMIEAAMRFDVRGIRNEKGNLKVK